MKYVIDDDTIVDNAEDAADIVVTEDDIDHDQYDTFLNDIYGDTLKVCGYEYDTAWVFREIDPTAYRCGASDWASDELEQKRYQAEKDIEGLWDGDEIEINDHVIRCVDDEQEDENEEDEEED